MSADIRSASLVDQLAGLVAQDADAIALAQALDPELQEIAGIAETCALLSRIADLTVAQCDAVARWFRFVELEAWSGVDVAGKRAVLAKIINVYRRRGTRWALERVLSILETSTTWDGGATVWDDGATVWDSRDGMYTLEEWWERTPNDAPFTYRVDALIEHRGLSLDEVRHLGQVLDVYVPARAHLLVLSETMERSATIACCSYSDSGSIIEVGPS